MTPNEIEPVTDASALLNLLTAQYQDLECLLALAQAETCATATNDVEALIQITSERTTIGERLANFVQQMQSICPTEPATTATLQTPAALQIKELVSEVLAQDEKTKALLLTLRTEQQAERKKLDQTQRGLAGYQSATRMPAIACDQLA